MGKGDTLITEKNGFYLWVCNNRMFDYCLTTQPYITLHSLVICSNDFYRAWVALDGCDYALLQKRVRKKITRLQLQKSSNKDDLKSF